MGNSLTRSKFRFSKKEYNSSEKRGLRIISYIKEQEAEILKRHQGGASGLETAGARSKMVDDILIAMFNLALDNTNEEKNKTTLSLVAQGGYGRSELSPGSDLDLLFLLAEPSYKISNKKLKIIEEILYPLWDLGFKIGHASRSISECIKEAKENQQSKTALMDARFIAGDRDLYKYFEEQFEKECVKQGQEAFFNLRREDIHRRHKKYSHTVFLQEPHVKESCGGLRDYQNVIWVARVKRGFTKIEDLADAKIITKSTLNQMKKAYDFLYRVRNELHYENKRATDILTLRLQGVVADRFLYPQKTILRRCEAFMRDYYRHTRAVYTHSTSMMEYFEIEKDETKNEKIIGMLPFVKSRKRERFEGFISRKGYLFLENKNLLNEKPNLLMRLFQHCQIRKLNLSPQARKYIHIASNKISKSFRYSAQNRETFRAILERRGEVARILRLMHRTKVLDNYLPEFGALDCLVQHEFFHRYTADEHTLRCIDQIDSLAEKKKEEKPKRKIYEKLFHKLQDSYAIYLALILHDTGRAENVREHTDGSAILADKVCRRLQIHGGRRRLIMFLVDHHLTLWRYATSRNLEDLSVIEEFAKIMKDHRNLEALLLFTWADSNATSPDAWTPWKEMLILRLYEQTHRWLRDGKEKFETHITEHKKELKERTRKALAESYHDEMNRHFELMPSHYFRFREIRNISIHIKSMHKFFLKNTKSEGSFVCDMSWINRNDRSHTELVVTTWNRPLLLEKVCCALAGQEINIIGADVYTRMDGCVCDIFQVCTSNHEPIVSTRMRKRVLETFNTINQAEDPYEDYHPEKYLKKKTNILRNDKDDSGILFPTSVHVSNELSPTCTTIEIQGKDRIGLLHDLFLNIDALGLATVHARILTERGAAMDTIYVTWPDGSKITDEEKHREIEQKLISIVS